MYVTTKSNNLFPYEFIRDFFGEEKPLPMRSDIYLDGNDYVIDVELPGIKKENISLSYEKEFLTISVKREEVKDKNSYALRERRYDNSERSYRVGEIDQKTISASFADGVLSIRFPKEQPKVVSNHNIAID